MSNKAQSSGQAGQTSKTGDVAAEVGVPRSSVDLHYFKRCREQRGDTYSTQRGEAKDMEMAGATALLISSMGISERSYDEPDKPRSVMWHPER
jgi:hypothetical protein